jgi:sulfite reductase beta subunit-like hemoprotein
MYVYDEYDQKIVDERVVQYRDQTDRFLAGKLTEAEFLPLRLQNGLYVQRLAPMLRIAVPYGLMSSKQLRKVAQITRDYDKGYAHFSTRQNIQLNWPRLAEVPDLLAELATVQMHAIQTSGNCIRNTTTDQFAGVAPDELEDPTGGSAPLVRNHSPVVHPTPGVRLPAAQIQDRRLWQQRGPGGHSRPRYRAGTGPQRWYSLAAAWGEPR